jgi:hypothetical protein
MSHLDQPTKTEPAVLEAGSPTTDQKIDDDIVDWDGPDDATNPLNWTKGKRWAHIIMVTILGLIP